ncbi:MAG: hypothetical protein JNK14_17230 [Chitinophagaceae bacterium]|nr:hypothetical protein [Chitinophagaceae bacterium]
MIISLSAFSQKRYFGKYYNPRRFWTDVFVLNKDSTFIYRCVHVSNADNKAYFDTSYGHYRFAGDTILFDYKEHHLNPFAKDLEYDSLAFRMNERHGYWGVRPQKLLWHKRSLYYIFEDTGEIMWSKEIRMRYYK